MNQPDRDEADWKWRAHMLGWRENGEARAAENDQYSWGCTHDGGIGASCGEIAPWTNGADADEAAAAFMADPPRSLMEGRCHRHMRREVQREEAVWPGPGMRCILALQLRGPKTRTVDVHNIKLEVGGVAVDVESGTLTMEDDP